ncbi:MAG: hypothetical protein HQ568_06210 [Calditrichaeota bacterium]|nr:hypothetical protein [Calditrichota bacterium]
MNQWTTHTTEYEETLSRVSVIAEKNGYILNPDVERMKKVVGLMTENFVQAGKYFCPCKQSHPLNTESDALCPCSEWKEEIEEVGHCFCRLFYQEVKSNL